MEHRITIFDTTLRDGEQSPGASMNVEEKLKMARQLQALGVDVIEAGFPISSDEDFEAVRAIARQIRGPIIAGLARATRIDIERAWEALADAARPRIHTFIATSDIHLEYKLKKTREQVLEEARQAVRLAKSFTEDVEFSAEDATRTDLDYLCQVVQAVIEEGATTVNIPDTVGYTIPTEFTHIITTLRQRVPNIDRCTLSVHCHNDLGLAVANSIAAIQAGARQVECTINGIGERAGNASLEEIVMALRVRHDLLPFTTGIHTEQIYKTSQLLSNITGIMVQPNKAIVGKNAFAHEAGIHQHGVLSNKLTYEIMTPESVGVRQSTLVLGKHSGRHALKQRFEEMGYQLSRAELDKAYKLFTKLADRKKEVFEEDLIAILQDGLRDIPETYALRLVQALAGNHKPSTATVVLERDGQVFVQSATGDGPVAAAYEAIDQITGLRGQVVDYTIRSVSRGRDAVGEVFVHVDFDGRMFTGKAASTDIVDASARAYLHSVNKLMYANRRRTAVDTDKSVETIAQAELADETCSSRRVTSDERW
ncbi:MAG: 2-isopropylmalate synthase [Acidobacteriota bacterium]|nr:2-isopropylmalate synthase [Blastocatellia bacterium]MDW8240733.1 2-isopropylmalate synthase [Acidobacteriota bacterium]